jgi:hypothetical protein
MNFRHGFYPVYPMQTRLYPIVLEALLNVTRLDTDGCRSVGLQSKNETKTATTHI